MRVRILLLVILSVSARSALAESPAKLICDGFEGSSASDRAHRFVLFSQSIAATISEIDPKDQACVVTKLDTLEEARRAYCEARLFLGHDLAADPLDDLTHILFRVSSDCERPRREADVALIDQLLPNSCDELLSSFLAYVRLRESNRDQDEVLIECQRATAPQQASSLVQACADGALSVRAAYIELGERVYRVCNAAANR